MTKKVEGGDRSSASQISDSLMQKGLTINQIATKAGVKRHTVVSKMRIYARQGKSYNLVNENGQPLKSSTERVIPNPVNKTTTVVETPEEVTPAKKSRYSDFDEYFGMGITYKEIQKRTGLTRAQVHVRAHDLNKAGVPVNITGSKLYDGNNPGAIKKYKVNGKKTVEKVRYSQITVGGVNIHSTVPVKDVYVSPDGIKVEF